MLRMGGKIMLLRKPPKLNNTATKRFKDRERRINEMYLKSVQQFKDTNTVPPTTDTESEKGCVLVNA